MARPISERDYKARWDAESLANAEEIKSDPARHEAAQTAAVKMAEEKRKELNGINRVANRAKSRETARKPNAIAVKAPNNKPKTIKRDKRVVTGNGFNVFKKI